MKTLHLATAALIAAAGTAQAGNVVEPTPDPVVTPPPAPAPVYPDWTGFYGGVQLGYGFANTSANTDGDGIVGGVRAGYDYDFGNYVMGVGVDYDFAGIDLNPGPNSIDGIGRLKARAGIDAGPALFYGTGGMALANASVGGNNISDLGYLLGAGIEYRVTEQVSVGTEVLWHDFGAFDNAGFTANATTINANLNFRF